MGIGLLALAPLVTGACSKPVPPQVVPKSASVTAVGPAGLNVVIVVTATNPNKISLTAQSFTGKARVDNKFDLGTVTVNKPVTLAPGVPTDIDVPMTLPWTNLAALTELAGAKAPVPYTVDGTVTVGGESLNVQLPFVINGTISPQQFQSAVVNSIPNIPGLTIPGGKLPQLQPSR